EGSKIPCGWFADWYVTPSLRGSGLGTRLLREISKKGYPFLIGHPGPQRASKLCLQNGWQEIPFQSSRRYIIKPYTFYRRRTRYAAKGIFLTFRYLLDSIRLQRTNKRNRS